MLIYWRVIQPDPYPNAAGSAKWRWRPSYSLRRLLGWLGMAGDGTDWSCGFVWSCGLPGLVMTNKELLKMEVLYGLYGFMGKSWEYMGLPSGKHKKSYWKWPFIVNFPTEHGDFPVRHGTVTRGWWSKTSLWNGYFFRGTLVPYPPIFRQTHMLSMNHHIFGVSNSDLYHPIPSYT